MIATRLPSMRAAFATLLVLGASCKQAPPSTEREADREADRGAERGERATAATPVPAEPGASHAVLVFAASQAGQLVPCGCSPDQRGGLPRAGALLDRVREKDPTLVYVDAGDALLASATPPSGPAAGQAELKARTLARADALLGAAARVLGARDLALGPGFAAETAEGVPLLDAGGPPVPGARATLRVEPGGVPVGIFAAGLGEAPERTIAARAAQLKADGARVVVLILHPRGDRAVSSAEALLPAARAAGVDLVVLGRRDDPATDPARVDPTAPPLFALEGHGQSLLRIDLSVPGDAPKGAPLFLARGAAGKADELKELDDRIALTRERAAQAPAGLRELLDAKVRDLLARRAAAAGAVETPPPHAIVATASFLPLVKDAGESPRLKALVEDYDARVAELNLAAARKLPANCPRPSPGEAAYLGVSGKLAGESCATCHAIAAEFWRRTPHAHAYQTLVEAKKQFSLDCIQCHVTGWQQPGGVCRIDRTAAGGPGLRSGGNVFGQGRRDVQCEMCHGPASLHAETPPGDIRLEVPEQICKRCHEAENSPHFNDARYRPWIVGPGHGEPLARGETPRSRGEIDNRGARGPNDPAKSAP
jgi:uncharacterized coiled-coil protein SlyX